jgi:hypothetical protein
MQCVYMAVAILAQAVLAQAFAVCSLSSLCAGCNWWRILAAAWPVIAQGRLLFGQED